MIAVFGCAYVLLVLLEIRDKLIYGAALVITSLVVTLLLSTLLHEYVAKPCIGVGRRLGRALETRALEVSA
jgi:peptidoglycan/LPS O-acetylase OafA/YrhL